MPKGNGASNGSTTNSANAGSSTRKSAVNVLNNVAQGAKSINSAIQQVAKAATTVATTIKVIKGLFNDPKWYEYHGEKASLIANDQRPFDSKNTVAIGQNGRPKSPGIGVTHVIYNNVVFQPDVFNSDAFNLATSEAFRIIREQLRSNLPYDVQHFRNYVAATITLAAAVKSIERILGWYTAARTDIPELHDALTHAPVNYAEKGKVTGVEINMVSDDHYAETVNKYEMLLNYVRQLSIPKKYMDYISWWVGSTFIDQSQPNPQLYINLLRDIPLYTVDSEGNLVSLARFDAVTSDIAVVIEQARSLLDIFGVVNADINKSGLYGHILMDGLDKYEQVAYDDKEFFNVLINTYQRRRDDSMSRSLFNIEYIRMDVLDGLAQPYAVGANLAATWWSGEAVPFAVRSQAAYLTAGVDFQSSRWITGNTPLLQDADIDRYIISDDNAFFFQHTGISDETEKYTINETESSTVAVLSPSNKLSSLDGITVASASIRGKRRGVIQRPAREAIPYTLAAYKDSTGHTKYFNVLFTDVEGKFYTNCSTRYSTDGRLVNFTGVLPQYRKSTNEQGYAVYEMYWNNGLTLDTHQELIRDELLSVFSTGSVIYDTTVLDQGYFEYTASARSLDYSIPWPYFDALFSSLVDYHIPIMCKHDIVFRDPTGLRVTTFHGLPGLIKECYVPVILSYDAIKYSIYQMLLGLFSIDATLNSTGRENRRINGKKV